MSSASPLAAETAAPRRWLSIVGIGEDGVEALSPVARGLIADAEIVFGGKRHLELAASLIRGAVRPWPSPFERAVGRGDGASRPAGLRAGVRRSVLLRRRLGARAPCRGDGNAGAPVAVCIQPRRRAHGLVAVGVCARLTARAAARSGPAAPASRRAHSGADVGRRGAARACGAAARNGLRLVEADRSGGARRTARADSRGGRGRFFARRASTRSMSLRWRSRPRPAPASSRAPRACRIRCSSMTGRSPSAKSAPSRCRRCRRGENELLWDIGAGSGLGGDRMDAGRSVAPGGGRRGAAPTVPRASAATPRRSAFRDLKWSKATRRARSPACRNPMRCSSAAVPPSRDCWTPSSAALASRRPSRRQRGDA